MDTRLKNPFPGTVALLLLWTAALPATSQVPDAIPPERIAVMARPSGDSIVLRWAPLTFNVWRRANENGYRVERYVLARNGHLLALPEKKVLQTSIKPLPEEDWATMAGHSRYAAIGAQALFGDRFEVDLKQSDVFTIVDKVKENDQRFAFALFSADMSMAVARASGLSFTDKQVKKAEKYLYRIVVNSMDSLRGNIFLGADDPYVLPEPQALKADFGERLVSLRWEKNKNVYYTAFAVERSIDGRHFTPISEAPLVTVSPFAKHESRYEHAVDTLTDLSATYYYRVRGITPFAELSAPSDVVSGRGTPAVGQPPFITSAENMQNTSLHLHWDFPADNERAIKGFKVERSSNPNSTFLLLTGTLLQPPARDYTDGTPGQVNYYKVTAMGLADEPYSSHTYFAQLIDSIPPVFPTGLQGKVTDNGKVVLTWKANTERDIFGYRVYKAFHKSEEPAQVTSVPLASNVFEDQVDLNTLNDAVYYSVMAIDQNQNHSALSQLLKLALPDRVKPQPPVFLPVKSAASGVSLRWVAAASDDIAKYAVYSKENETDLWKLLAIVTSGADTVFHYIDHDAIPGGPTLYTVVSIDDAGLESEPARAVVGSKTVSPSDAVTWRKALFNREENTITLRWTYLQPATSFRIFKAVDHQRLLLLTTLPGKDDQFTDLMKPGRYYAYRIMALFDDGHQSLVSEEFHYQY
jgi:hypothetical protein